MTGRAAANASHWKIFVLASVALMDLTGLLMLQLKRGTSEEQEIAYGKPRTEASADAVAANVQLDAVALAPTPASAPASEPTPASSGAGTRAAREPVKAGTSDPVGCAANPGLQAAKPFAKALSPSSPPKRQRPPSRRRSIKLPRVAAQKRQFTFVASSGTSRFANLIDPGF